MSAPIPVFSDRPKAAPTPKLRALVKYPGNILGGTGIDVTKANGIVTIDMQWNEFSTISAIPTSPTSNILTFDTATNTYVMVPSQLLGGDASGIADVTVAGSYVRQPGSWTALSATDVLAKSMFGIADVRSFGAVAGNNSATNGVHAAMVAIKAAGYKGAFLPKGFWWFPSAVGTSSGLPQTLDNFYVIGEDCNTSIISVPLAAEATTFLVSGPFSRIENCGIKSAFGYTGTPQIVPLNTLVNTRNTYQIIETFNGAALTAYIGRYNADTVSEQNAIIIHNDSTGGSAYLTTLSFGYSLDIANSNTSTGGQDRGILIRNTYAGGATSGPEFLAGHVGIQIDQPGSGGTVARQDGIMFARSGDENSSLYITDSGIAKTHHIIEVVLQKQGVGDFINLFHQPAGVTMAGNLLEFNMGVGDAAKFTGFVFVYSLNSVPKYLIDKNGNTTGGTYNGVTLDNNAWTFYTPTVSSTSGTTTASAVNGRYKVIGKTCFYWFSVTVTAVGSGSLLVTLPFTVGGSANFACLGFNSATAAPCWGIANWDLSNGVSLRKISDNSFPVAIGETINCNGQFEMA